MKKILLIGDISDEARAKLVLKLDEFPEPFEIVCCDPNETERIKELQNDPDTDPVTILGSNVHFSKKSSESKSNKQIDFIYKDVRCSGNCFLKQ